MRPGADVWLGTVAAQTTALNPFHSSHFLAVIVQFTAELRGLGQWHETTRFHYRNCWISNGMAAGSVGATAAGDAGYWISQSQCYAG